MRKRKEPIVEYNGLSLSINEWIRKLNLQLSYYLIHHRIFYYNWPVEKAFYDSKKIVTRPKGYVRNVSARQVDEGIEAIHLSMLCRGYFRKENRIKIYKQLNGWYKEFRAQSMKAA